MAGSARQSGKAESRENKKHEKGGGENMREKGEVEGRMRGNEERVGESRRSLEIIGERWRDTSSGRRERQRRESLVNSRC